MAVLINNEIIVTGLKVLIIKIQIFEYEKKFSNFSNLYFQENIRYYISGLISQ